MGPIGPVLEQTDRMSQGLESHPIPYFLALTLAVVGVLWGTLSTVIWWAARNQRELFKQLHHQERERAQELKRERNEARDKTEEVRADHFRDLVRLTMAAEGLIRMRDELKEKKT